MNANSFLSVLKIGGAQVCEAENLKRIENWLVKRHQSGEKLVIVHGGGPEIGKLHEKLKVPFERHEGLRVTSEEGLPLVTMVLGGLVNTRLVALLNKNEIPAVGTTGLDRAWLCSQYVDSENLGQVGEAPKVNPDWVQKLLGEGSVPIVAPLCMGPQGTPLNVNADSATQAIAIALQADSLDFVTDVPGILDDEKQRLEKIPLQKARRLLNSSVIQGGMIPKLEGAIEAVESGVGRVRIGTVESLGEETATEILQES